MKRIFLCALVTLGILLSFSALGQLYRESRKSSASTIDPPRQLAGLRITNSKFGTDAIAEFTLQF